jgi:hypothetical protein
VTVITLDAEALWAELGDVPDLLGVWPDEQAAWLLEADCLADPAAELDERVWPTLAGVTAQVRGHHLTSGLRALVAAGQADVDGEAGFHRLLVARPDVLAEQVGACLVTGSDHPVGDATPQEVDLAEVGPTLEAAGRIERGARLELHEPHEPDGPDAVPAVRLVSFVAVAGGPVWLADPSAEPTGGAPGRAHLVPLTDDAAVAVAVDLVERWIAERSA